MQPQLVHLNSQQNNIITCSANGLREFRFDTVFPCKWSSAHLIKVLGIPLISDGAPQVQIYEEVRSLVSGFINGINGCVFAYGTFTILILEWIFSVILYFLLGPEVTSCFIRSNKLWQVAYYVRTLAGSIEGPCFWITLARKTGPGFWINLAGNSPCLWICDCCIGTIWSSSNIIIKFWFFARPSQRTL